MSNLAVFYSSGSIRSTWDKVSTSDFAVLNDVGITMEQMDQIMSRIYVARRMTRTAQYVSL